jgi:hypothetical protein
MHYKRQIILFFLILLLAGRSFAQVSAVATLDTTSILIGDQINLAVSVTCPKEALVVFPQVGDTIISKIEVIRKSKVDTVVTATQGGMKTLFQKITITSFDSGYFAIPPFTILYKNPGDAEYQGAETEPLLLEVRTVQVDMSKEIKDIKDPLKAPVTFKELLPWILAFLALCLIIWGIIYYMKKRKKAEPLIQLRRKPELPPHVVALDALESLRAKKLWQSGRIKEYHTELTEIIRTYIENKFHIRAIEMVTEEILESIDHTVTSIETRIKLRDMLQLSDLVKFAKERPLPDEEEKTLNYAIDFVRDTINFIENAETH